MTKTITSAMSSHIGQETTTLATCWRIIRNDGVEMYFTDHDVDLVYASATYKAATGFSPTRTQLKGDMSVDNLDVEGVFGTLNDIDIEEDDLLAGVYDEAVVEIFLVNHVDPDTYGQIKLVKGTIGNVTRKNNGFEAEVRSLAQKLQQVIGEVYSPFCRADLGDTRCSYNIASVTVSGAVTSVVSRSIFHDSTTSAIVNASTDHYNLGLLTWVTGNNSSLTMEVKDFSNASGIVELVQQMPYTIQTGDIFTIYPGCDKSTDHCKNKFNNIINFRGEPFVPGKDYLGSYPDAK